MDILDTGLQILEQVAPTIATMIGGPLAGTAVAALERALGLAPTGDKVAAMKALASATPEQLLALRQEDNRHAEAVAELGLKREQMEGADRQGARDLQMATRSSAVPVIATIVLLSFALTAGFALYGAYQLMTGDIEVKPTQVGLALAGATLVGTIIGYFAANAQTVISFYFGSSHQSATKTDQMAQSMNDFMQTVAKGGTGSVVPLRRAA